MSLIKVKSEKYAFSPSDPWSSRAKAMPSYAHYVIGKAKHLFLIDKIFAFMKKVKIFHV